MIGEWFAKPKKPTSVEYQTEERNSLYLTNPVPNPAREYVKTKLYFDQGKDINQAEFSVYNIFGSVVSQSSQLSFSTLNAYSGEITWNCQGFDNGVYFISVRLGSHTRAIPIVLLN